jgi:uncharacterized membrane protein YqjE
MDRPEGSDGTSDGTGASAPGPSAAPEPESHPARELSVHLLRMLETRMEAAGIAIQGETQLLMARLQLKLLVGAALFFAVWGGIVLLAVALPEHLRVPVLSAVVGAFALLALVAHLVAKKKASPRQPGSMRWFLDSLRQDLELLSRALSRQAPQSKPDRSPPHDLAA